MARKTKERPLSIICPQCGKINISPAHFCTGCGLSLEGISENKKRRTILPVVLIVFLVVCILAMAGFLSFLLFDSRAGTDTIGQEENADIEFAAESKMPTDVEQGDPEDEPGIRIERAPLEAEDETEEIDQTPFEAEDETEETVSVPFETESQEVIEPEKPADSEESENSDQEVTTVETEEEEFPEPVVKSASATSELSEYGMTHTAKLAIDGSTKTGWVEAVSGQGIGESITLTLTETSQVSGFTIWAGYHKSSDLYQKNSRPSSLQISFSDSSMIVINLEDNMSAQTFYFEQPVMTDQVVITIQSVYPGTKYEDTVISEIQLF